MATVAKADAAAAGGARAGAGGGGGGSGGSGSDAKDAKSEPAEKSLWQKLEHQFDAAVARALAPSIPVLEQYIDRARRERNFSDLWKHATELLQSIAQSKKPHASSAALGHTALGECDLHAHRFSDAAARFARALECDPAFEDALYWNAYLVLSARREHTYAATARRAMDLLNRIAWRKRHEFWMSECRKGATSRWLTLVESLLLKGDVFESMELAKDAADCYTQIWELTARTPLPPDAEDRISSAFASLYKANLLRGGNSAVASADCCRLFRGFLLRTPEHMAHAGTVRASAKRRFARLLLRGVAHCDYVPFNESVPVSNAPNDSGVWLSPKSAQEEAVLLLLLHQLMYRWMVGAALTPLNPLSAVLPTYTPPPASSSALAQLVSKDMTPAAALTASVSPTLTVTLPAPLAALTRSGGRPLECRSSLKAFEQANGGDGSSAGSAEGKAKGDGSVASGSGNGAPGTVTVSGSGRDSVIGSATLSASASTTLDRISNSVRDAVQSMLNPTHRLEGVSKQKLLDEQRRGEDELCLALCRSRRFDCVAELYRSSVATNLEAPRGWYKLALALMSANEYGEAFLALSECLRRDPHDVMALLLAGKLCLNHISRAKHAVHYAERALQLVTAPASAATAPGSAASAGPQSALDALGAGLSAPAPTTASSLPRHSPSVTLTCYMLHGVSSAKYAYRVPSYSTRKALQKAALDSLKAAAAMCPHSQPLTFHLALLYADIREHTHAIAAVKKSLSLDRTHGPSWALLALLLSSRKQYADALAACDSGIAQLPVATHSGSLRLVLLKAKLLAHLGEFERAVDAYNLLVDHVFSSVSDGVLSVPYGRSPNRFRPSFPLKKHSESEDKTPNHGSPSVVSSGDSTGSSGGMGSGAAADKEDAPNAFKIEILLSLAQLYAGQPLDGDAGGSSSGGGGGVGSASDPDSADLLLADAFDCVYRARELASSSGTGAADAAWLPDIHAQLAALCVATDNAPDAIRHYESALAVDPAHTRALIGLAAIQHQLFANANANANATGSAATTAAAAGSAGANLELAYGYLTAALQVDGTSHFAWYEMGLVLKAQAKHELASEHLLTALEFERTAPLVCFSFVRRTL